MCNTQEYTITCIALCGFVSLASVVEIFEEPQKDMPRCGRGSHSTSVRAGVEGQEGTIMHAVTMEYTGSIITAKHSPFYPTHFITNCYSD